MKCARCGTATPIPNYVLCDRCAETRQFRAVFPITQEGQLMARAALKEEVLYSAVDALTKAGYRIRSDIAPRYGWPGRDLEIILACYTPPGARSHVVECDPITIE